MGGGGGGGGEEGATELYDRNKKCSQVQKCLMVA